MVPIIGWKNKTWSFDLPIGAFPTLLERVRGTPARAAELVAGIDDAVLSDAPAGKWSAKEHLGHLDDLDDLDTRRLEEYLARVVTLTPADPSNRRTTDAGHRAAPVQEIITGFHRRRAALVRRMEALTEDDITASAIHPRLQRPMRLVDWAQFVADHDDHHLAHAREAIRIANVAAARSGSQERGPAVGSSDRLPRWLGAEANGPAPSDSDLPQPGRSYRSLFEIPEGVTFLNCANMSPQLRAVTEAGLRAVREKATPWMLTADHWFGGAERLRTLFARLVNGDADGVALVPAASYGIAVAAANVQLQRGQSVVLLEGEFPSNVYAWRELARRCGGRIVMVRREPGVAWTEAVLQAIDDGTAVVSVPNCHWTDGSLVDLVRVGEKARAAGAALVVDASQSLGAWPFDVAAVRPDFLVTVGYKWLLGPYGLGYLYAAPRWRDGTPIEHSWLARAGSDDFSRLIDYTDEYRPGARRFDMGEFPQFVLAPMAAAALRQILEWRVDRIQQSLSSLTESLADRTEELGGSALPRSDRVGHMLGIRLAGSVPSGLAGALAAEKVYVSVRGDSIRVAPHLYNDERDIERLIDVLRSQVAV